MKAPEPFVELLRCALVNPRRNIDRARRAGVEDRDYYLAEAAEQIAYVESLVSEATQHTFCTCPTCGHTHYLHGDDA